MDEYNKSYNIDKHMLISEQLYEIHMLGKHILQELKITKNTKSRPRSITFVQEYDIIYSSINDTINLGRFRSRLFLTLKYYLDEALFAGIPEHIQYFYIANESYNLTKLYFDQDQWIKEIYIQEFSFTNVIHFNADDAILINCFFMKYEYLLKEIEQLVSKVPNNKKYKRKITQVLARIRKKHAPAIKAIETVIQSDIKDA